MAHPKDIAAMIVSSKKPMGMPSADGASPMGPDDSDDQAGQAACAEDIMSAIKSGDADALAQALMSFLDMCPHH